MILMPMVFMAIENENDSAFVQSLFLKNEQTMFRIAKRIVKDDYTARDMVSEACVTMLKKTQYLRGVQLCKRNAYINKIVQNESLMYLRKRRSEHICLVGDEKILDCGIHTYHDMEADLIAEAEVQELRAAMKRIHKKDQDLLRMKYFEDLPDEEIAAYMGIGKDSVRYYLTKARRNLKAALKGSEEHEG